MCCSLLYLQVAKAQALVSHAGASEDQLQTQRHTEEGIPAFVCAHCDGDTACKFAMLRPSQHFSPYHGLGWSLCHIIRAP
jgi:hypothetical protein